jgi:uncharacterized coiled-coil DUF342 family protein
MRQLWPLVFLALAGCPKKVDTAPIAAEAAGLQQSENELVGRRGNLQRERSKLNEARKELSDKRAQAGRDGQAALDEEEKQLSAKEADLTKEESTINQKFDELLKARAELVNKATASVGGGGGPDPLERAAQREHSVAEREKSLARREAEVAEREKGMAAREAAQARREKETCGAVAIAPPKIEMPKGLKYSQKDVEPIYKKALKIMQDRGILQADLPPGTGKLLEETREAMKAADYVRAKYSADQLLATVEEIKVDRNFISAKMARLSAAMRGKKLDGEPRKSMESVFQEATANYGDGRFSDANTKLNKLFAMLK